jgi:hypothetical protein
VRGQTCTKCISFSLHAYLYALVFIVLRFDVPVYSERMLYIPCYAWQIAEIPAVFRRPRKACGFPTLRRDTNLTLAGRRPDPVALPPSLRQACSQSPSIGY